MIVYIFLESILANLKKRCFLSINTFRLYKKVLGKKCQILF